MQENIMAKYNNNLRTTSPIENRNQNTAETSNRTPPSSKQFEQTNFFPYEIRVYNRSPQDSV